MASFQHDWGYFEVPLQPCSLHVTSSTHVFTISESTNFFHWIFSKICKVFIFVKINSYIGVFWSVLILIENFYLMEKHNKLNFGISFVNSLFKNLWKHVMDSLGTNCLVEKFTFSCTVIWKAMIELVKDFTQIGKIFLVWFSNVL